MEEEDAYNDDTFGTGADTVSNFASLVLICFDLSFSFVFVTIEGLQRVRLDLWAERVQPTERGIFF